MPQKKFTNGDYDGDLLDGKRHGFGKLVFHDGDYYDGEWRNDAVCLLYLFSHSLFKYLM
jgi:hypothetical protein